jgi:hypothetical protein
MLLAGFALENILKTFPTTRRRISFSAFHFLNLYHTQEQDFSAMTCRKMLTEGLLPTLHVKYIFWDSWAKLVFS